MLLVYAQHIFSRAYENNFSGFDTSSIKIIRKEMISLSIKKTLVLLFRLLISDISIIIIIVIVIIPKKKKKTTKLYAGDETVFRCFY